MNDYLQDMADSNFKLYKRNNNDREFGAHLLTLMFEEFWRQSRERGEEDE